MRRISWNGRKIWWLGLLPMMATVWGGVRAEAVEGGWVGPQVVIKDSGMVRVFGIMLDELAINRDGRREFRRVGAGDLAELRAELGRLRGQEAAAVEVELVAFEAGVPHLESKRRLVTRRILVTGVADGELRDLARDLGLVCIGEPGYAPGMAILEAADPVAALEAVAALRARPMVGAADVLLARPRSKKRLPNDPLFGQQWHHRNLTQGGGALSIDTMVTPVWDAYHGTGVTIGIIDDGIQHSHPDLQANYNPAIDYDFNSNDADPGPGDPTEDAHGTACAGVAAARGDNGVGVCGVADQATLAGLRLIAAPATDQQEADAFSHRNDVIQVKSNSWGAEDDGRTLEGPGPLAAAALANGTATGRGGRGTIFVFAGGNGLDLGDNSNYDGYANSIHTIAVGAVNDDGFQSYYSERGANLHVCAPSNGGGHNQGMVTTDLIGEGGGNKASVGAGDLSDRDYTREFGGTSAATPVVAGICALMLEANPGLGWRDVQEILLRSARQVHHTDSDWTTNGAGLHFNHKYGAGLVDAQAAVAMAKDWVKLGTQTIAELPFTTGIPASIPDNNAAGISRVLSVTQANLRVEHVTLTLSISHASRGDLEIVLTSPSGTSSKLAEQHFDPNANYSNWTFSSVRHWGETAAGNWTLTIRDRHAGAGGTLGGATLKVHGSTVVGARVVPVGATLIAEGNLPANAAADPGERVAFAVALKNPGAAASGNLTATLLEVGGVGAAGPAQSYGSLAAGGPSVSRTFEFVAGGGCGSSTKLVLRLEDATGLLGYATCQVPLGARTETQSAAGGAISILDDANASPYPSVLGLSGIGGRVQSVKAAVNGFAHTYPYDVSLILKGPDGLFVTLFSDATETPVSGANYLFEENAAGYFPSGGGSPGGSYRPWDPFASEIAGDTTTEAGYSMIEFAGLDPNGTWGLYAADSGAGDSGSISSWNVSVTAVDCVDNIYITHPAVSGGEGTGSIRVSVTRTGGREGSATVYYTATAGTAAADADFTPVAGTLTFAPGERIREFAIPLVNDSAAEPDETIQVTLSAVAGNSLAGAGMTGVVTIIDDDQTALEAWRQVHFGSPSNSGDGADLNDFDHDGLANLVEYGFGLDPKRSSAGQTPRPQRVGGDYVVSFTGVAGVTYAADWSTTLAPGSWLPMSDAPTGAQHRFSVAAEGHPRLFVRLRVSNP